MTTGELFNGQSAAARAVSVDIVPGDGRATGASLRLRDAEDHVLLWPLAAVEPQSMAVGVQLRGPSEALLQLPAGPATEAFLLDLAAGLAALAQPIEATAGLRPAHVQPPPARLSNELGPSWALWGPAALLIAGAVFYGSAPLSAWLAPHVPVSWERRLGTALANQWRDQRCPETASQTALDDLLGRLQVSGGELPLAPRIFAVDLGVFNAFTLPGGTILVDWRLLRGVQDSAELAGVLAHELGHVRHRHIMREAVRGGALSLLWSLLLGDLGGVLMLDPSTLYRLLALRFDRAAELEADADARQRLRAAQIDPSALGRLFARLPQQGELAALFSTHPSSAERLGPAPLAADTAGTWPAPMSEQAWLDVRQACSDRQPRRP